MRDEKRLTRRFFSIFLPIFTYTPPGLTLFRFFRRRNAEEVRREDNELQGVSQHVITVDGEAVASVNGKLLAGHTIGRDAGDGMDQVSVCSCTCVGPVQYDYNSDVRPGDRSAAVVRYSAPCEQQPVLSTKRVSI